jgi:hypothetical protein
MKCKSGIGRIPKTQLRSKLEIPENPLDGLTM